MIISESSIRVRHIRSLTRLSLVLVPDAFPHFKLCDLLLWFKIIPSQESHIKCDPWNFVWDRMGLHYPKLDIFAQSLLDTRNLVDLIDFVDGMDIPE